MECCRYLSSVIGTFLVLNFLVLHFLVLNFLVLCFLVLHFLVLIECIIYAKKYTEKNC